MKQLIKHNKFISCLLAVLMILAYSSRLYLTHDHDFNKFCDKTERSTSCNNEWVSCNCPICHAEDAVATQAELFEYNPFLTTISYEFAVCPTAKANDFVAISSQRGPPFLS